MLVSHYRSAGSLSCGSKIFS